MIYYVMDLCMGLMCVVGLTFAKVSATISAASFLESIVFFMDLRNFCDV